MCTVKNIFKMALQRRTTYLIIIACLVVILWTAQTDLLLPLIGTPEIAHGATEHPKPSSTETTAVYQRPTPTTAGRSRWATLPTRYPVSSYEPLPRAPTHVLPAVQFAFPEEASETARQREDRQNDVKRVFERCWQAYHDRAWLHDELAPISGGFKTTFGGWAATLVDSLDSLWILGMRAEFAVAVEATLTIDFANTTSTEINLFETTIRYLGGLVAAYDLSGDTRLLDKSLELADMLYVAFDTPNRMPITRWKVQLAAAGEEQIAEENVLVAELGSLALEFTRLSQITRDPKWYDAVQRIMVVFAQQQNHTNLPGMWPLVVNPRDLDLASGTVFTLGAMSDSLYEYLPKMFALLGGSAMYESMYRDAMSAAVEHTLFRPMLPEDPDILIAGSARAGGQGEIQLEPQGQHLVCFAGGMLALGGRLMQDPAHVSLGRKVTEGCTWAYKHSPLGIMPEIFNMLPCDKAACAWNESTWHAGVLARAGDQNSDVASVIESRRLPKGFTSMDDRRYLLRPEAIESVFILYRITGDPELQEVAWEMWQNIDRHTKTDIANAALTDMSDSNAPKADSMESFWTAETLKYFYLIFSEPSLISLDDYVFNTEAHPFRRPSIDL